MSLALNMKGFYHRKPEHPGAFLERCYLKPLSLSQSEFAKMLGVSRRRVNEIVNGQRSITADTAIRLAKCLKTTPMFWLEKQQLWELYEASHEKK
ncbi:MAG: HigA family addiction module antidote protein [Neptuniibacter sp.]